MSVLAWLMLVLNAAHALPMAAAGQVGSAIPATTGMLAGMAMPAGASAGHPRCDEAAASHADHSSAAQPAHADDCCGAGHADASCHCPALCAPALLPMPVVAFAARLSPGVIASGPIDGAPHRPDSPPLRPPQR